MSEFDRTQEDIGNIVCLEHINILVPDQQLATTFYGMGLGLTRDPYLMTGTTNMWMNVGRAQFHLPTGEPQVLRGHTGVVIEGRNDLLARLEAVKPALAETKFTVAEHNDYVELTCPWGNRIRCYEPSEAFGSVRLGMPYVLINAKVGSAAAIARFYEEIIGSSATVVEFDGASAARVSAGAGQHMIFRETDEPQPDFDGHHVAIYLANFSRPYNKLKERGLISRETDQHEWRFIDVVDLDTGEVLSSIEHEVRSMRHPMYARPLVNRNPSMNNRNYVPGYQDVAWAQM